jgi:hypothetical protein
VQSDISQRRGLFVQQASEENEKWTLKQVQGDDTGQVGILEK